MNRRFDLTGQTFGRLTVIEFAGKNKSRQNRWLCQCECGNRKIVSSVKLRSGNTKSCGCYHSEISRKVCQKRNTKHGMSKERVYKIWIHMKKRCQNPNETGYENYGGRGITVCDEWLHDFQSFYDWSMANGYADNLTIDRIDNDGNYDPGNCRWATKEEQDNNRRSNHLITYNGTTQTLKKWSDSTGIPYHTLKNRINRSKWDIHKALTTPVKKCGGSV